VRAIKISFMFILKMPADFSRLRSSIPQQTILFRLSGQIVHPKVREGKTRLRNNILRKRP
jgi:hypothetical protein